MKLRIKADSYLKALPLSVQELKDRPIPQPLISVSAGDVFPIVDHAPYNAQMGSDAPNHTFVQLASSVRGATALRWFVDGATAEIEGTELKNDPKDEPAATPKDLKADDFGPTISIPGISRPVGIYEPIYFEPKRSNFTWSEMLKGGSRIPVDKGVTMRIIKLIQYMDEVRAFLGNRSIIVTSGYRDPVSNRAVGGASRSRHMVGDAIDFYVDGLDVVDVFYKLKSYHRQGGLAVGNGFVHLDLRPGAPARWTYPGGPVVSLW